MLDCWLSGFGNRIIMKKPEFLTVLFAISICFLGCKEQVGPCGDPPNFYVNLKFIDKTTLKNAFKSIDSIDFFVQNEKVILIQSTFDSSINFEVNGYNFRKILYRIKPKIDMDTLNLFYRFESYKSSGCSLTAFILDSIYSNNKKIESNTIYY
jgi:hypothetical protein